MVYMIPMKLYYHLFSILLCSAIIFYAIGFLFILDETKPLPYDHKKNIFNQEKRTVIPWSLAMGGYGTMCIMLSFWAKKPNNNQ